MKEWLDSLFAGEPIAISFPPAPQDGLSRAGGGYCREIPYGETKTYGQLAQDFLAVQPVLRGQAVDATLDDLSPCYP